MKKYQKNCLILLLVVFFLVALIGFSFAQKELEVKYPNIPGAETPVTAKTPLPQYIRYIFNFTISLVGFFIFIILIRGGVKYLTSAGNPAKMEDAKKQLFAALVGLIIILCSYLILYYINPQLLFLQEPELIAVKPDIAPPVVPLAEQTLKATELPIGKLIDWTGEKIDEGSPTSPIYDYEGVIAETRLERIKILIQEVLKTAKKTRDVSEKIVKTAEKIKSLTDSCSCSILSGIGCAGIPGCGGVGPCQGGATNDPCEPVRPAIIEQQGIMGGLISELAGLRIELEELAKKVLLEEEKLNNALSELEKAESIVKNCSTSISERGSSMVLLNTIDFWSYREAMEREKIVKAIDVEKPWPQIYGSEDESTFYCSEAPSELSSLTEISDTEIEGAITDVKTLTKTQVLCKDNEIPLGEVVDKTEDIAQRIIQELGKIRENVIIINKEVLKEINNGNLMAALPDSCTRSRCSPECSPVTCCETIEDPVVDPFTGEPVIDPFTGEPVVTTREECSICDCVIDPCSGEACPYGEIAATLAAIQENHGIIDSAYQRIKEAVEEIIKLIDGERSPTWAKQIINKELPVVKDLFGRCSNPAEDWTEAVFGEKILAREILACEQVKYSCSDLDEDYKCYGEGDPAAFPNYFCGETETK